MILDHRNLDGTIRNLLDLCSRFAESILGKNITRGMTQKDMLTYFMKHSFKLPEDTPKEI